MVRRALDRKSEGLGTLPSGSSVTAGQVTAGRQLRENGDDNTEKCEGRTRELGTGESPLRRTKFCRAGREHPYLAHLCPGQPFSGNYTVFPFLPSLAETRLSGIHSPA